MASALGRPGMLLRTAVALLSVRAVGCSYGTPPVHVPSAIRTAAPDGLQLAEVTLSGPHGDASTEKYAEVERDLRELVGEGRGVTERSARMAVHVEILAEHDFATEAGHHDGCGVVPFVLAAPAGANVESDKLRVDVTIQAGGRTLRGSGTADRGGSIYAG